MFPLEKSHNNRLTADRAFHASLFWLAIIAGAGPSSSIRLPADCLSWLNKAVIFAVTLSGLRLRKFKDITCVNGGRLSWRRLLISRF